VDHGRVGRHDLDAGLDDAAEEVEGFVDSLSRKSVEVLDDEDRAWLDEVCSDGVQEGG
jgi:hypothetical protein